MRERIVEASIRVLVLHGLNDWTVDEVARQAGCAKGLVNYHHRSKRDLLTTVAQTLRDRRWTERIASAREKAPLDRLWQTLMKEVNSGRFAAWLGLLSADPMFREASRAKPAQSAALAAALDQSLGLGNALGARSSFIAAVLDGLELRLLEGESVETLEEAYHRFWLTLLEM